MKLIKVTTEPGLKIELENILKIKKVVFVWEDALYHYPLHIDSISVSEGFNCYSAINKGISFFDGGVTFKVIDPETYDVVFSHTIQNLSFLNGKRILYVAQNNHTGYGYAARNYIHQLLEGGYEVQWESTIFGEEQNRYVASNKYEKRVLECRNNRIHCESVILHNVPIGYGDLVTKLKFNNRPVYSSTVWETTKLPYQWAESINKHTCGVIVPSRFNKQIFSDSKVEVPIHLWRHDIFPIDDRTIKYDIVPKMEIYRGGKFEENPSLIVDIIKNNTVYYNISQYSARKNIDQTLLTFCTRFSSTDRVCFMLKTFFRTFSQKERDVLKYKIKHILSFFKNPPPVIVCLTDLDTEQINDMHKLGDVYFTLNRGEGFGLCSYTAKKFGNRVICGGFGSEVEFLNGRDVILPYHLDTPSGMIGFHNLYDGEDQKWAAYNDDEVVERLRFYPKRDA